MKQKEELKQKLKKIIDDCNDDAQLELLESLLTDMFPATVKLAESKKTKCAKRLDK